MTFKLEVLNLADAKQFKIDAQDAFQKCFEEYFGKSYSQILPESDIDNSLGSNGAIAYKAILDGTMVGGAIVVVDIERKHGSLDLLYVRSGEQGKSIGKRIWQELERRHPEIKVWETCTPYFDKRNIHFYVNVCKFHIVEFYHPRHPDPATPNDFIGDGGEGMFKFRKDLEII